MPKSLNPTPTANLQDMQQHLRLLFGDLAFTYQTYDKMQGASAKLGWAHVPVAADLRPVLRQLKALNAKGLDVAVVPNRMNGRGRKASDCRAVRFLFIDLDGGGHTLKSVMALLPVKPHLVVRTSKGRYHAYWRVKDVAVDAFKPMMLVLADKYGGDRKVADPSRCMRLAGTWHHKRGELAKLVYPAPDVESLPAAIDGADFMTDMKVTAGSVQKAPAAGVDDDACAVDAQTASKISTEDVRMLLRYVDPSPRDNWLTMGMALHSRWPTAEGYQLWDIWSRQSSKFDDKNQHETWNGFNADGKTTLGTLVHLARQSAPELPTADELSFAQALVLHFAGYLGFDSARDAWWRFDGNHWKRLVNVTQALQAVRDAVAVWSLIHGPEAVRELNKTAVMAAALRRAALETALHINADEFDTNPDLMGVLNGVVNLRTQEFRPGRPEDRVTLKTTVAYDPAAKCLAFKAFVLRLCCGDKAFASYVLRVLGYCLTCETKEQKLFMFLGSGGNGKGVLMNTTQNLFGDYAVTLTAKELMRMNVGDANAAAPAIARLKSRRLMLASELVKGKPLDEAFVKQLSGGDKMTSRNMYEGQYTEFRPTGKLVLLCNDPPPIPFGAEAMWRRIVVLPSDAQLTDSADDKALPQALAAEAPGILNLLIRYAGKYLTEQGIGSCKKVQEATQALRNRADTVKAWVDACCREEVKAAYAADDAQKAYRAFTQEAGAKPLGPQAFSVAMARLGFERTRRGPGVIYRGVRSLNGD